MAAENEEEDRQGSEDCFLEDWPALRARLEDGRLEVLAAGSLSAATRWAVENMPCHHLLAALSVSGSERYLLFCKAGLLQSTAENV